MLITICGEDTISSRNYLNQLKAEYLKANIEIRQVPIAEFGDILGWIGSNMSLFSTKTVFFTEHLESIIIKKRGKKPAVRTVKTNEDIAIEIASRKDITVVNWEEKQGREIKLKEVSQVKEFKPATTIFKLLEECYPSNLKRFVSLLQLLTQTQDEMFLFIMLYRHIRTLILAQSDTYSKTCPPWQKAKLKAQSKLWKIEKLVEFYEGLARVESSTKSGNNPHGIRKSLEILACYYL